MSDTWSDIQAVKSQSRSYRERMLRRRKEREGLVADLTSGGSGANAAAGVGDKAKAIKGEARVGEGISRYPISKEG